MSVNGSGTDRRTSKPKPDPTSWTVKTPSGVAKDEKSKPLAGLDYKVARAEARNYSRRTGVYASPVRT